MTNESEIPSPETANREPQTVFSAPAVSPATANPAAFSGISYDPFLPAPQNPNCASRPIFYLASPAPPAAESIPHPASLVYDPYASQAGISEPGPPAASTTHVAQTGNLKPQTVFSQVPDPPLAEPGPPDSEESRRSISSDRGRPLPDNPWLVLGPRLNRSPPPPLVAGSWQPQAVSCAAS